MAAIYRRERVEGKGWRYVPSTWVAVAALRRHLPTTCVSRLMASENGVTPSIR